MQFRILFVIFAAVGIGFASASGQVLLLREVLTFFAGFEPGLGVFFTAWLFWTALGAFSGHSLYKRRDTTPGAAVLPLLFCAILPAASLAAARGFTDVFGIPAGEIPSGPIMVLAGVATPGPFCFSAGFAFSVLWSVVRDFTSSSTLPIYVYLGEALGAALGGAGVYMLLHSGWSSLTVGFGVGVVLLAVAAPLIRNGQFSPAKIPAFSFLIFGLPLVCALPFLSDLDDLTRRLQWGENLVLSQETPYGMLAVTAGKGGRQATLFSESGPLYTMPDPQSRQYEIHPALLQHPAPQRVLLIGGEFFYSAEEILKHPGITSIVHVTPDRAQLFTAAPFVPAELRALSESSRIHAVTQDPAEFIRSGEVHDIDVVLIQQPDPDTAAVNRFYTLEFFRSVKGILSPDGLVSLEISAAAEALGPLQLQMIASIKATLEDVFPAVMLHPGDTARFFAGTDANFFSTDPAVFKQRLDVRGIDAEYIRAYYLIDRLSPFRLEHWRTQLHQDQGVRLNRDFRPAAWRFGLELSAMKAGDAAAGFVRAVLNPSGFALGLGILIVLGITGLIAFSGISRPGYVNRAVGLGVCGVGACGMTLQVVLLLCLQILSGNIYILAATLLASFMAGIGLGAGVEQLFKKGQTPGLRRVLLAQALLAGGILLLIPLLHLLQSAPDAMLLRPAVLFPVLGLIFGTGAGVHFASAVRALQQDEEGQTQGGLLYGLDLLGAAAAAPLTSFFLLPVFGVFTALAAAGVFCLATMAGPVRLYLLRRS